MSAIYQENDPKANCFMIANRFAESIGRSINSKTVSGAWSGYRFEGKFKLSGGTRYYKLTCESGIWSVFAE